jgi:hypothetical protein
MKGASCALQDNGIQIKKPRREIQLHVYIPHQYYMCQQERLRVEYTALWEDGDARHNSCSRRPPVQPTASRAHSSSCNYHFKHAQYYERFYELNVTYNCNSLQLLWRSSVFWKPVTAWHCSCRVRLLMSDVLWNRKCANDFAYVLRRCVHSGKWLQVALALWQRHVVHGEYNERTF